MKSAPLEKMYVRGAQNGGIRVLEYRWCGRAFYGIMADRPCAYIPDSIDSPRSSEKNALARDTFRDIDQQDQNFTHSTVTATHRP